MRHRIAALCAVFVLVLSVVAAGGTGAFAASAPKEGGTLNVVVIDNEFLNLDPAHDENDVTDENQMNALYGGLFTQTPSGGIGLGMASAYKFSNDNKTFTITIKPGIKFTDGTPLNAATVAWNINRDLLPANACDCLNSFEEVTSTVAVGNTVVMTTKVPDVPLLQAFIDNAPDWPASETAIKKDMAANGGSDASFGQNPVGAGPFMLGSFVPNSKVALVKNPNYYVKGEPYISSLNFTTTPVDQSGYSALQSGGAQLVVGVTTVPIIKEAESAEKVLTLQNPVVETFEMNSNAAPFNNANARAAVAYALNTTQLLAINSPAYGTTVEGLEGPASPYYEKVVPGYKAYNLAKAKALVSQIGGLSLSIQTGTSAANSILATALENGLSQAGIKVTIVPEPLTTEDNNLMSGNWQVVTGASGGIDPDIGPQGLPSRFSSTGLYTCCKSTALDGLINQTIELAAHKARGAVLDKIQAMVAANSWVVPLYATDSGVLYAPSLQNLTAAPGGSSLGAFIDWPDLSLSS